MLCKHDECEHKKRLNFHTQYKISTAFCNFIPKCKVGRLSIRFKIEKEKKISNIKTTNANRRQQQKKIIAKLGFETRSLVWKAKIIATGVLYYMAS